MEQLTLKCILKTSYMKQVKFFLPPPFQNYKPLLTEKDSLYKYKDGFFLFKKQNRNTTTSAS